MGELEQIIQDGFCIGCGGCAVLNEGVKIRFNDYGMYQAHLSSEFDGCCEKVLQVCPFSNAGPNEDNLGDSLFGKHCVHDGRVGFYQSAFVGHILEGEYRRRGSSGGLISWLCCQLLEKGLVDGVVHVKPADRAHDGKLFEYGISRTVEEVIAGAKSRYYPVEMSEVLEQIKTTPGSYVVVGLPCFIKMVRRLMLVDSVYNERIKFCIGLVCGHLKSTAFADCFAWQVGIEPSYLEEVDFRIKRSGEYSSAYGVYLRGSGIEDVRPARSFFGSWWGHNFFRYPACSYCDDVFAETADIVVGDAWLSDYITEGQGNSVVIVRNSGIAKLIEKSIQAGKLRKYLESLDRIASSQAGGLRDRRNGLAYRLYRNAKTDRYQIRKRVKPSLKANTLFRRQIYFMRLVIEARSHRLWKAAVERNDYAYFHRNMMKYVIVDALLPGSFRRMRNAFHGWIRKILERMHILAPK